MSIFHNTDYYLWPHNVFPKKININNIWTYIERLHFGIDPQTESSRNSVLVSYTTSFKKLLWFGDPFPLKFLCPLEEKGKDE